MTARDELPLLASRNGWVSVHTSAWSTFTRGDRKLTVDFTITGAVSRAVLSKPSEPDEDGEVWDWLEIVDPPNRRQKVADMLAVAPETAGP